MRRHMRVLVGAGLAVLAGLTTYAAVTAKQPTIPLVEMYGNRAAAVPGPSAPAPSPPSPAPSYVDQAVPQQTVSLPGGKSATVDVTLMPTDTSRPLDPSVANEAIRSTLVWAEKPSVGVTDKTQLRSLLRSAVVTSYAGRARDAAITKLQISGSAGTGAPASGTPSPGR